MGDLLFISPVMPSPTGKGVGMRAFATLEALAARHAVTCVVVPLWEPRGTRDVPSTLASVADVVLAPPGPAYAVHRRLLSQPPYRHLAARLAARLGPWPLESLAVPSASVARHLHQRRFDRVHAFRLCTAPFAAPLLDGARLSIDLDDLESGKLRRVAALPTTAPAMAAALTAEADLADRLLDAWSRRASLLLVASERDRARLASAVATPVVVAPNVVRVPHAPPPLPTTPPHRILFVGGLDYAPNRDAVTWLVREIARALARTATAPWEIHVIGRGGPELLAALRVAEPRIVAHGQVPDVAPHLAAARAVVVPLRAGGGTRIKILEALAHGRPVVATTLGAEGLDLVDGTHLLLADTAEGLATQVARVLSDGALAGRLAAAGRERVSGSNGPAALARALATI